MKWGCLAASRGAFLVALFLFAGCGYRFPGQGADRFAGRSRVAIERFVNRSQETGLENEVGRSLGEEFVRRGGLQVVSADEKPDLKLSGTIHSVVSRPVAFTGNDAALQYQTVMIASASLRDSATGQIIWSVSGLRQDDTYGSVADAVVVQSAAFQAQQTLSANDLQNVPEIQLSEGQKREALERILESFARDVYNGIVEDF